MVLVVVGVVGVCLFGVVGVCFIPLDFIDVDFSFLGTAAQDYFPVGYVS